MRSKITWRGCTVAPGGHGLRVEVPAGVAERTFPKAQGLHRGQLANQRYPMTAEGAVAADLEGPVAPILRQERIRHLLQQRPVPHDNCPAVQQDVETLDGARATGHAQRKSAQQTTRNPSTDLGGATAGLQA